jgi:hypothetical protein
MATIKNLQEELGSLSQPSKMPCYGFSIPAKNCKVGGKLSLIKDSVCFFCYAKKGRYIFENVQNALSFRFEQMFKLGFDSWADKMIELICKKEKSGFFRWHDSGDLQSVEHLKAIAKIANALPSIKFWLPTREYKVVQEFSKENEMPENLTIRLSAFFVGKPAPINLAKQNKCFTSTVDYKDSFQCNASKQGNQCLNCRACWDKSVENVNYPIH